MAHYITSDKKHRIVCDVCGPCYDANSAEEAEEYAIHHLCEDIGDENPRPHQEHKIEITQVTIVESL